MDVSAAASSAIQGAVAPGAGATPAPAPPAPADDAVARFHDAMGAQNGAQPDGAQSDRAQTGGQPGTQPGAEAQAAPPANEAGGAQLAAPEHAATPGDAILRGLGQMSQGFDQAMQQATSAVNSAQPGGMMSTADLMKMQMSFTQMSMQQDLVGKVVGKVTQNVDTFLKNQ